MRVIILTPYPEMFPGALGHSIIGNALDNKKFSLETINLHDFGIDKRGSIDDQPFGGGPGMVIRPDVVENALNSVLFNSISIRKIFLTPSGQKLTQNILQELSQHTEMVILCGRFEGVDQRVIETLGFQEISIGDYVLSGGEIAAQVLVEGCIRLIPGVLGQPQSLLEETFSNNLLEYPHYTRPQVWEDNQGNKHEVPEVLTSGHHEKIERWRKDKSIEKTKTLRPDLFKKGI
jgi:tRNA (guanine37-N1)-methyltransferase